MHINLQENPQFLRNTVQGKLSNLQEYAGIHMNTPSFEGYAFKEILQSLREYTEILHNTHESTGKPILISQKYCLKETFEFTGIYRNTQEYPRFEGYMFIEIL